MTTRNATRFDRATEIGREYAAAYRKEFGQEITPESCGDWDSTAWAEALAQLIREEGVDHRDSEEVSTLLDCFRDGLFGPI